MFTWHFRNYNYISSDGYKYYRLGLEAGELHQDSKNISASQSGGK